MENNNVNTVEITTEKMAYYQKLEAKEQKQRDYQRRQAIKSQLLIEKAKKADIKVTKAEIDAKIAELDAGNKDSEVKSKEENPAE